MHLYNSIFNSKSIIHLQKLHQAVSSHQRDNTELLINPKEESIDDEICYFEISEKPNEEKSTIYSTHDPRHVYIFILF